MKNKYFWPYYTAIVVLLIWLVISCIMGMVVTSSAGEKGNYPPIYFFPLLIFAVPGILLISMILTFVKVTDNEIICFKYGFLRYRIKFADVTEWGTYITSGGRGTTAVLYITSIPTSELRNGEIIVNKKVLKHKNKRKFIMLGYDDKRLIDFLKEKFSLNKAFLYEKPEYLGSIDENSSIIN
jgi:hypothetical protein